MPFEIVRNDITQMTVDAIVNTANPRPVIGSGTDAAIHKKAGPALLAARQRIGRIDTGCAAVTPAKQPSSTIRQSASDTNRIACFIGTSPFQRIYPGILP